MFKMMRAALLTMIISSACIAHPAIAQALQYLYTPTTDNGGAFSFVADRTPTPTQSNNSSFDIAISNATGSYAGLTTVRFYGGSGPGQGGFGSYTGPTLYSGTTSNPTLLTGQFTVTNEAGSGNRGQGTLNVVTFVPGVPEPAAWTLLIAGFGAVGGTLRRRRRLAGTPAAA